MNVKPNEVNSLPVSLTENTMQQGGDLDSLKTQELFKNFLNDNKSFKQEGGKLDTVVKPNEVNSLPVSLTENTMQQGGKIHQLKKEVNQLKKEILELKKQLNVKHGGENNKEKKRSTDLKKGSRIIERTL